MKKYQLLLFVIISTACSNKIQENKSEWISLTDGKTFDN